MDLPAVRRRRRLDLGTTRPTNPRGAEFAGFAQAAIILDGRLNDDDLAKLAQADEHERPIGEVRWEHAGWCSFSGTGRRRRSDTRPTTTPRSAVERRSARVAGDATNARGGVALRVGRSIDRLGRVLRFACGLRRTRGAHCRSPRAPRRVLTCHALGWFVGDGLARAVTAGRAPEAAAEVAATQAAIESAAAPKNDSNTDNDEEIAKAVEAALRLDDEEREKSNSDAAKVRREE